MDKPEWIPDVYPKSQSIWCPNCSEEFGIEREIERAEKRGQRVLLEYLIRHFWGKDEIVQNIFKEMLKQLEEK